MAQTYRVRDWQEHFETSESRKLKGPLKWVAVKTKHDGKTYRQLMKHPRAGALYGAWVLIVAVAGKCPTHGVLADEDGPLTADDLANKTGLAADAFTEAIEVLASAPFRWLETIEPDTNPLEPAGIPAASAGVCWNPMPTGPDITGPDRTGHNQTKHNPTGQSRAAGFYKSVDEELLKDTAKLMEWLRTSTKPDLSVDDEQTRLRIIGLAVHVTTTPVIQNKAAAFVSMVKERNWKTIDGPDEDEAQRRHRTWQAANQPAPSPTADLVSASFTLPTEQRSSTVEEQRAALLARFPSNRAGTS